MEYLFQGGDFFFVVSNYSFGRIDDGVNDNDDNIFSQGLRYIQSFFH